MYAKLFSSLYQGTLRGRSNEILVFTNLLAHTGRDGTVDKHFRAIAEETGLTQDEVQDAIAVLEAPDPESRSPEEQGARIVRLDEHRVWGWRVVNHGKYRAIRSEEDRAEQNRLSQKRWRERHKQSVSQSKPRVSNSKQDKPMQKQRQEAEAETKAEAVPPQDTTPRKRGDDGGYVVPECFANVDGFTAALAGWIEHRKKIRKPPTGRAIQLIVNKMAEHPGRAVQALDSVVSNGWQGFEWAWLDSGRNGRASGTPRGQSTIPGEHETLMKNIPIYEP